MSAMALLSVADREFFALVAQTAFCNPFTRDRRELDARIVGHPVSPFAEGHVSELAKVVSARVKKLDSVGALDLKKFSARDRELMQTVFLFELFHRFYHEFDALILEQVKAGAKSLPVPFAAEVLEEMRERGIGEADAPRFFAIFYQLRRAYHFIVRGLVGKSPCMQELRRHLWQNVFTKEVSVY